MCACCPALSARAQVVYAVNAVNIDAIMHATAVSTVRTGERGCDHYQKGQFVLLCKM